MSQAQSAARPALGLADAVSLVLGIHPGRRTQNALTLAKVLGLASVVFAGLYLYARPSSVLIIEPTAAVTPSYTLAMIAVLWAYSGWHEVAYVVADLRDNRRNFA